LRYVQTREIHWHWLVADRKILQTFIGSLLAEFTKFVGKVFWGMAKGMRRGRIALDEQEGVIEKWDA